MTFKELKVGTLFNTKDARFVKVTDTSAVVVSNSLFRFGSIETITPDLKVIKLYNSEEAYENDNVNT